MANTYTYSAEDKAWDKHLLERCPGAHYWQGSAWGHAKTHSYWPMTRHVLQITAGDLPVQSYARLLPGLGRVYYLPEIVGVNEQNLPVVTRQLRDIYAKGFVLKMELYQPYSEEMVAAFTANGWRKGKPVQHRTTVMVDLQGTEDELFMRIKGRARYEVRVAQRNQVRVEKVPVTPENLNLLSELLDETARRTGGYFRSRNYMERYWQAFTETGQASLYFARHDGDLLAAAFVITFGDVAWYKDGGSIRLKSNMMAPRLLQWEIMRDLQRQGIRQYDLSGIPAPEERETSPLRGLFTFKTGFSEEITRLMPAMELPLGRRYKVWRQAEKRYMRLYAALRRDYWY